MCSRCGCLTEPKAQIRPAQVEGILEAAVLTALVEGPLHGYALAERLVARGLVTGRVAPPRIYETLATLERHRAVRGTDEPGEAGPSRRRYALTASGRRRLARWREALERLRAQLDALSLEAGAASPGVRRRRATPD